MSAKGTFLKIFLLLLATLHGMENVSSFLNLIFQNLNLISSDGKFKFSEKKNKQFVCVDVGAACGDMLIGSGYSIAGLGIAEITEKGNNDNDSKHFCK